MSNWREILVVILSNIAIGVIIMALTVIIQRKSCDVLKEDLNKVTKEIKQ